MYKTFYNPFEKYSAKKLVPFGILFTIIGVFLAYNFNAIFDGVLDLHFSNSSNIYQILTFIIVDIALLANVLVIFGKYINPKTRMIDIYTTVLIAKIPAYLFTIMNANSFSYNFGQKLKQFIATRNFQIITTIDIGFIILQTVASMFMLFWTISLLYNGFKTATNTKETKDKLLFVAAIILAEIISKIIIYKLS
jgi:hypothetical protein